MDISPDSRAFPYPHYIVPSSPHMDMWITFKDIVLPQIRISLLWCTICQIIRFANHDSWISRAICVLFMGLFGSWSFHYYPNHDPDNRIFWTGLSIYLLYQFYLFIVLIVIYLFISYIQLSCFKSPTLPGIEPRKLNWKSGVGASCYKTLLWDK